MLKNIAKEGTLKYTFNNLSLLEQNNRNNVDRTYDMSEFVRLYGSTNHCSTASNLKSVFTKLSLLW